MRESPEEDELDEDDEEPDDEEELDELRFLRFLASPPSIFKVLLSAFFSRLFSVFLATNAFKSNPTAVCRGVGARLEVL
jgi:hypothetical protein